MSETRLSRTTLVVSIMRPFVVLIGILGAPIDWIALGTFGPFIGAFMGIGTILGLIVGLRTINRLEAAGYVFPIILRDGKLCPPDAPTSLGPT
jgi:hypothetical protein